MVHIVNKGKNGEREIVILLNEVIERVIKDGDYSPNVVTTLEGIAQRNQNQSAAGGCDIPILGLAIEVKRQETLSIEEWWRQTVKSAARNGDQPILIYRQNRKAWHVVMDGFLPSDHKFSDLVCLRVQFSIEDFRRWFKSWVIAKINNGELDRV